MDNFREWLSDNLRYILLGVAGILLLIIAFFAVKLIKGIGSSPKKQTVVEEQVKEDNTKEDSAKEDTAEEKSDGAEPAQNEVKVSNNLVRDDQKVYDIVSKYYNACAAKDYDTLKTLCETFDESTQAEIESQDSAIESYNNIMTYSKEGLKEGSYVVYVYFDAKLTGISTPAPSLRELYLVTNSDGNLVIADREASAEQKAFTEQLRTDADVQALITDVNKKLADAEAADEDLKNFIESDTIPEQTGDDGEDNEASKNTSSATGPMMANTGVNVRGEASADSAIYGSLYEGMQVEVLENLDSGWSKIQYTAEGTTIIGYVMTQYLSPVQ